MGSVIKHSYKTFEESHPKTIKIETVLIGKTTLQITGSSL
jgi:hypothetical protein